MSIMRTSLSKYSFVVLFSSVFQIVICDLDMLNDLNNFKYEQMHYFGQGRKVIPDYRRMNPFKAYGYEHPEPLKLPVKKTKEVALEQWSSFTQGHRKRGDKRVYSKKFDYKAHLNSGHKYYIDGAVECIISAIVLDTEGATPIKLRGGVGYHHFAFVVLAKSGQPLKGRLQAYCPTGDGRRAGGPSMSVETDIDAD